MFSCGGDPVRASALLIPSPTALTSSAATPVSRPAVRGTRRGLSNCLGRAVRRHLSAADERFGLRLSAGLVVSSSLRSRSVLLLLVRAGWPPLRNLDAGTAAALNQFGTDHLELVKRPRSSATSSTRTCSALRSR